MWWLSLLRRRRFLRIYWVRWLSGGLSMFARGGITIRVVVLKILIRFRALR